MSLLDGVTTLVLRAGAAVREAVSSNLAIRLKDDQSPVTAADEASQAVILDGLARLLPGVPVVSEESRPPATLGTQFVLVDPLDGTRELIDGRPEYTINVALIDGGAPVLGVVAAPAMDLLWRGAATTGAERLAVAGGQAGAPQPIRARPWPAARPVAAVSRSHLDAQTEAFIAALGDAERISIGSALKLCRIAEGTADVYPRLAPTSEWDIAAGHAVLAAAGGAVVTSDGTPLRYGHADRNFLIPAFIAWGDPARARSR
jgi:3'(2'), 5'-bisphosphate nucleotidase